MTNIELADHIKEAVKDVFGKNFGSFNTAGDGAFTSKIKGAVKQVSDKSGFNIRMSETEGEFLYDI